MKPHPHEEQDVPPNQPGSPPVEPDDGQVPMPNDPAEPEFDPQHPEP